MNFSDRCLSIPLFSVYWNYNVRTPASATSSFYDVHELPYNMLNYRYSSRVFKLRQFTVVSEIPLTRVESHLPKWNSIQGKWNSIYPTSNI